MNDSHGLCFDSDHIEKLAVHFSIAMDRAGVGEGLPTGPLDKYLPPKAAPAPSPADTQD